MGEWNSHYGTRMSRTRSAQGDMRRIVFQRLHNLRLLGSKFRTPAEVVGWLVAVQSQDFAGAKWAVGSRVPGATDEDVERAYDAGAILRTHALRPTWHFLLPADIRWVLALTAPRVHAQNAGRCRQLQLDAATFRRTQSVLGRALAGGNYQTRDELRAVLRKSGIHTDNTDQRMAYIMMNAELDGVVCSGPRRGKQFTYALLDERAPPARSVPRDDAIAMLARRFYASRWPATARDFAKWSGLTVADARKGFEAVGAPAPTRAAPPKAPVAHLLSIYDEYVSSYKDRSAMGSREDAKRLIAKGAALYYIATIDGRVAGTWKRELSGGSVDVTFEWFRRLAPAELRAVERARREYAAFLAIP